jgi:hypothetical protein
MKTFLIVTLTIISIFFSTKITLATEIDIQSGLQYDWWEDNKDNKASQAHIPLKFNAYYKNYSIVLLTGYATTHVEDADEGNQSLSRTLDTKVNLSYELPGKLPVDILLGLDFNLPTGKTDFKQEELILIMDPDLISITSFGEGYNINPTLTVAGEWGNWVAGAGAGYLWRGEYDFSEEVKDYDPGDIVNINAEVHYFFSSNWSTRLFGSYVWYGKDKVDGEDFHQEGNYYLLGIGTNFNQNKWDAGLTVRSIFRDRSKLQEATGGLIKEDNKSHGNEYVGDVFFRYLLNNKTAVKTFLQGLYITENEYSRYSSRFIGSREKITFGLRATRRFASNLEGGVTLKGFVMHVNETNFPETQDSNNYRGFSLIVKITTRFRG